MPLSNGSAAVLAGPPAPDSVEKLDSKSKKGEQLIGALRSGRSSNRVVSNILGDRVYLRQEFFPVSRGVL